MTMTELGGDAAADARVELEVVVILCDVERAKKFDGGRWRLDATSVQSNGFGWSSRRRPARDARSSSAR